MFQIETIILTNCVVVTVTITDEIDVQNFKCSWTLLYV